MNKLRERYCDTKGINFIDFETILEAEEYILFLENSILRKSRINLKKKLKKHIESNNGKGSYDDYIGSILESDIIEFIKECLL